MPISTVFDIASQGMSAERLRLEAASSNLANANSTRTAEGGPYRRRDVVLQAVGLERPELAFSRTFEAEISGAREESQGVAATALVSPQGEGVKRYMPGHPDADADGYVNFPDVDPLEETVNMISAARNFEANATVFNTAKEMARTSLKLGDV
jgi:flagellar basal-body rod protein FlgC